MTHRQGTWLTAVLIAITAAGTLAFAQPAVGPAASGRVNHLAFLTPEQRAGLRDRFRQRVGRMELRAQGLELTESVYELSTDPVRAAILQMQRIERIYRQRGDHDGLEVFYRDILDRTDNLAIRNVAWLRLGELTARGEDIDGALALFKQGLEENLRRAD